MISVEEVWPLLIASLRAQDNLGGLAVKPQASKWARHGEIAAYCRVISRDPGDDVLFNDPSKVLLEARSRIAEEDRTRLDAEDRAALQ